MFRLLFLFCFFSASITAQDINALKCKDTIYIVLKEVKNNHTEVFKNFKLTYWGAETTEHYTFTNKPIKSIIIKTSKSSRYIKTVNRKKFMKKNKQSIIDMDFIKDYTPEALFINHLGIINSGKTYYVIYEEDLKNKEIKLVEAHVIPINYTEM